MEPDLMDPEYLVDEPITDYDMANGNDIYGEEQVEEVVRPPTVESTQADLESIAKSYTSYGLMNRLLFIADVCPPLRYDALKMLIEYIMKNTQNVPMLMQAYQKVEQAKQSGHLDGSEKIPPLDNIWVDSVTLKSQAQLEAHLCEFKRQKDEAVKESIRRSLDEVFHQHVQMGNIQEALKLYGRGMREYCTAPNYVLQMLISWINVTVYANQWQKLGLLLPQAERAITEVIDRENITGLSGPSGRTSFSITAFSSASSVANVSPKNYKELVQSSRAKIAAVSGLAKMQDRCYKQAAEKFMTVDIDTLDYPQLLSASDVAIYGTLCALATFNRVELKERVLGSTLFRKFLESEPKLVDLLQKFCRSEFGSCLDILAELEDQLLLNMFLAPHIHQLRALIRKSSIVQYFHPYLSVSITHMAQVFRTTPDEMERELIDLIEKGHLNARIDSYGKILHAKFLDNRVELYKRILKLQSRLQDRVYAILLRAALQNHRIGVGFSEKAMRRRRANAAYMSLDAMMDSPADNFFEPNFSPGGVGPSTSSSNVSGGSKLFGQVQKLFSAAASRIHPGGSGSAASNNASSSNSVGDPVDDGALMLGINNAGGGAGVAEIIPAVPNASSSLSSVAPATDSRKVLAPKTTVTLEGSGTMASNGTTTGGRGATSSAATARAATTNSDMELDEANMDP